jgi:hypothetical protein
VNGQTVTEHSNSVLFIWFWFLFVVCAEIVADPGRLVDRWCAVSGTHICSLSLVLNELQKLYKPFFNAQGSQWFKKRREPSADRGGFDIVGKYNKLK